MDEYEIGVRVSGTPRKAKMWVSRRESDAAVEATPYGVNELYFDETVNVAI